LISKAATLTASREPRGLNAAAEGKRSGGPVIFCLVAAVAGSATLLLIFQSKLTFTGDDWSFLIERQGRSLGVFLDPHHGHLSVLPVTIYKALLSTFGMSSSLPFSVVSTLVFLLSAVLLFVYLRRRVGDWRRVARRTRCRGNRAFVGVADRRRTDDEKLRSTASGRSRLR